MVYRCVQLCPVAVLSVCHGPDLCIYDYLCKAMQLFNEHNVVNLMELHSQQKTQLQLRLKPFETAFSQGLSSFAADLHQDSATPAVGATTSSNIR